MELGPVGRLAFRWLTSIAITWAFIAAIMTATAQERVTATLEGQSDKPTYSSALGKVAELAATKKEMTDWQRTATTLNAQVQAQQKSLDDASSALTNAWEDIDVDSIATQARKARCDITVPAQADPRFSTWHAIIGCLRAGTLPANLTAQFKYAVGGDEDYGKLYDKWSDAQAEQQRLLTQQRDLQNEIAGDKKLVGDGAAITAAFSELDVLRAPWLGRGFLIQVPPALLQILVAFISGAFGALLVTLVLVVYPKSQFASEAASQEYGSRLLLGGLISMGVFVILSGGSAVLGSSAAFSQNQANFMTFSAVGVLAGMFSDRVAAWLSERANAFFSDHKAAGAANDPGAEAAVQAAAKAAAAKVAAE